MPASQREIPRRRKAAVTWWQILGTSARHSCILLCLVDVINFATTQECKLGEIDSLPTGLLPASVQLIQTPSPRGSDTLGQRTLYDLVRAGSEMDAVDIAINQGRFLFAKVFDAADGVGCYVTRGVRFTQIPRADLTGPGEWASQRPARTSGPDAQSCNACHFQMMDGPQDLGAGPVVTNVVRDPRRSGMLGQFIQRQPPHLLGTGAKQCLAEEMTEELQALRILAKHEALAHDSSGTIPLTAKGISFGEICARRSPGDPLRVTYDFSHVNGVDTDLVVKPFHWKGDVPTLRMAVRDAAYMQLGMQPTELVNTSTDGDRDGVVNELPVGDITALTLYTALQPRPTTLLELDRQHLLPTALTYNQIAAITAGQAVFEGYGCSHCHVITQTINNPIFSEPSQVLYYRESRFPSGINPVAEMLSPRYPLTGDLTADQSANRILLPDGQMLGNFTADTTGRTRVTIFSDLKRHAMGPRLAEPVDETGSGAAVFLTAALWGVGSTAPYLHDGRALSEAIRLHGGEAQAARDAFTNGTESDAAKLLAFLNNLVIFKQDLSKFR
jgi:cytochrome c2